MSSLCIGIDVGSTTVKLTVVDPNTKNILWQRYERHETRQAEKVLEMLEAIESEYPNQTFQTFITGSGGSPIAPHVGAKFVQEVNAVTFAVEKLHPDVESVVELGGQDAKIIFFKTNPETGEKQSTASMNDKCASGTGATLDKCFIKVGMPPEDVVKVHFDDSKLHHVAAKCGVFAETDIVNLVKSGIPQTEILCSLADAIVQQNLSVLTRGNTLRAKVLLLGGPNTYLPFLQECWRLRIPQAWEERGYKPDPTLSVDDLIFIPDNAEYYAAYGAVLFGIADGGGGYKGIEELREFILHGRKAQLGDGAGPGLVEDAPERDAFVEQYTPQKFYPDPLQKGDVVEGVIGLDGGSTSSKLVLINAKGKILQKVYTLSKGNPIADMKDMMAQLRAWAMDQGATLKVTGFGVTGYAGDVLETSLQADANIVETVAHMQSACHYFPEADVICDIGGQDIKVLFLRGGDIKNFRLSNSCSAGNGMLLQAMADQFGVKVQDYASTAFDAQLSPVFSYGCAVFLDSDRVNFQKEGFAKEELLAGLALVLPKNIWQYVVQIPRMAELGKIFVLQGGTQHNLAAVKAQVDYIKERVPGAEVYVHPHTGEAGAIGAAMEALRVVTRKGSTSFVGLDSAIGVKYVSRNDETTQCHFCPNDCSRTFIDTVTPLGQKARYISGFSCEKGTVEDEAALKALNAQRRERIRNYPNLVEDEAKLTFKSWFTPAEIPAEGDSIQDVKIKKGLLGKRKRIPITRSFKRSSIEAMEHRAQVRIGMPKVLNMWSTGPFWRAYFEALGVNKRNVVFSDDSSEDLWQAGGKYGSVDPCYPSKVAQAHIHNLLFKYHVKKPLEYIFFPSLTHIPTYVDKVMDTACCPIVAGTPEVIHAAFTKEKDFFAEREIGFVKGAFSLHEPYLLKRKMFEAWGERLQLTEDESNFAIDEAFKAWNQFDQDIQDKGREILTEVKEQNRMAILLLGRPYHNDPGLNHSVLEEFQALGYPILSMRSIPKDDEFLMPYFQEDIEAGIIDSPTDVRDVWPENFSVNSVQKVWAAKFAARHPNVAVLDLSSFKCGHDAPTYGLIDKIIETSGTPYSALHDIDANKPGGSIKIRVKTYAHTLQLACEALEDKMKDEKKLVGAL